ncbi:histidine phosphatase superfamily, partial [Russula dissimulans]
GVNPTTTDINALQQICAYDVRCGTNSLLRSGFYCFCRLFTENECEPFKYYIGSSHGTGPESPAVVTQGIGCVSEFTSRRYALPSSTLLPLFRSLSPFPFKESIYVDATHDTTWTRSWLLNLTRFASSNPLPTEHIQRTVNIKRPWVINHIAPFATNLVTQVLSCPASNFSSSTPMRIRWTLNDAIVLLTGVKGRAANKHGLCDLPTGIKGTPERITEGQLPIRLPALPI